jgi:hypothetical protein
MDGKLDSLGKRRRISVETSGDRSSDGDVLFPDADDGGRLKTVSRDLFTPLFGDNYVVD